jgi:hypothetical protein
LQARRFATALIDEFGAEFVANPPCQPALAGVIGREDDGEMRGNFEIFRDNLHAAIRDVRNGTVARQRSGAALDLRDSFAQFAFTFASVRVHVEITHRYKLCPSAQSSDEKI